MTKKSTLLLSLITIIAQFSLIGQTYEDLTSVNSTYGTVTSLTPVGTTVTSNGYRGEPSNYNSRAAVVLGDKVIFTADDGSTGDELWVTDGTRAGTILLKDIESGSGSSSPENMIRVGDKVYFAAETSTEGKELWVTDGTSNGTTMVIDLFDGPQSSNPNTITPFKGGFLFAAFDENSFDYGDAIARQHMWFSDGTSEGTVRLSSDNLEGVQPKTDGVDADARLSSFQLIGDTLAIFGGTSEAADTEAGFGILGEEIWVTNGSPEPTGTKMLLNINTPDDDSNIQWLFAANEKQVIFRAKTDAKWDNNSETTTTLFNEYWVTDGTTEGTYLLQDLNSIPLADDPNGTGNTGAAYPINYDGKIYYRAQVDLGNELYRMNSLGGEGNQLELAFDIAPFDGSSERPSFIDDPFLFDGKLFMKINFRSDNLPFYPRVGNELGLFDSEDDSIRLVAEISMEPPITHFPAIK